LKPNDFLLTPADISWFRSIFNGNLTEYPVGGHLGNLYIPTVQDALARLFSDDGAKRRHRPDDDKFEEIK
jgi:hypothetical protein